jgi:hypothetical protein
MAQYIPKAGSIFLETGTMGRYIAGTRNYWWEDQARRLEAEKKELARLEKGKSRLPPFRPSLAVATNSATLSYTGTSGAAGAATSSSQKQVKFDFDYMVSSSPFSLE